MKKTKLSLGLCFSALLAVGALTGCSKNSAEDEYDDSGRLIVNLKNVYWEGYDGKGDMYTDYLNEKFGITVVASHYNYDDWDGDVNNAVIGDNLTDTIHFNLKDYNFGAYYENWVDQMIVKQIPDDLSRWPNLANMLSHITNLESLKIDGHLYGIPIINDLENYQKDFSNMTYIYRRDWVKAMDAANVGKTGFPTYRENDEYTWAEFENMMDKLKAYIPTLPGGSKNSVLVDESWGFPSVTNFYKDAPHCYTTDASGRAIANFTSEPYLQGLEKAKSFVAATDPSGLKYYSQDQFNFKANTAKGVYKGDQAAIYYDNFNVENYGTLRDEMRATHQANLDDATAFLKIKDPVNNKYCLEGMENWFSMTLFNYDISDNKMEKILNLMDYLLSEEGTRLAVYGIEGYDYNIVDGKVVLTNKGWEKDQDGNYIAKLNGAKMLRKMASLGNETKSYDPLVKKDAYEKVSAWQNEMALAKANNKLKIIRTPSNIAWMSAPHKNEDTEGNLEDANTYVLKYAFDKLSKDDYLSKFNTNSWNDILQEINQRLGF